jgi:hypothetical protein
MELIQLDDLPHILGRFELGGKILEITPVSAGHINDTFASRVRTSASTITFSTTPNR